MRTYQHFESSIAHAVKCVKDACGQPATARLGAFVTAFSAASTTDVSAASDCSRAPTPSNAKQTYFGHSLNAGKTFLISRK